MINTIFDIINNIFRQAFSLTNIPSSPILLIQCNNIKFGDYQINGIMGAAKLQKTNPNILAQNVVDNLSAYLQNHPVHNINSLSDIFIKINIAGAGFINLTINNEYLAKLINNMNVGFNGMGEQIIPSAQQETIVVDYSSPNLAKEMHVGHLRSSVIGDCLARVLQYLGYKVIRQNHVGDWGTQFGMLIAYMINHGYHINKDHNNSYTINNLEEFYRNSKLLFDSDENFANQSREYVTILQNYQIHGELGQKIYDYWQIFTSISLNYCYSIYKKLNLQLANTDTAAESTYQSYLSDMLEKLEKHNLITISQGAKCIFLNELSSITKNDSPLIIQKQDGGYLYATTDLAALDYRINKLKANKILYVVDARQSLHFKQLFLIAERINLIDHNVVCEHIAFGTMMNSDGKPFKTRDGGTIKLNDLIDEAIKRATVIMYDKHPDWSDKDKISTAKTLAINSLKYADLSKNRTSDYIFDYDKILSFEGNTAPYLLYAYTRIYGILKKNNDLNTSNNINNENNTKIIINEEIEHHIALHLINFIDTIRIVANECYPHHLCSYLYELATLFMKFYELCPILNTNVSIEVRDSRLQLVGLIAKTLDCGFNLLGIRPLDKM